MRIFVSHLVWQNHCRNRGRFRFGGIPKYARKFTVSAGPLLVFIGRKIHGFEVTNVRFVDFCGSGIAGCECPESVAARSSGVVYSDAGAVRVVVRKRSGYTKWNCEACRQLEFFAKLVLQFLSVVDADVPVAEFANIEHGRPNF